MEKNQNDTGKLPPSPANPLVSIIIPVYNREQFIAEALESIIGDPFENKEIIVVDDGSTDKTPQIISGFDHLKIVTQKNKGVSAARNEGLKNACGKYITFLDSDDIWIPGRLEYSVTFMKNQPDLDFILGLQQDFLEEGCELPQIFKPECLVNPQKATNNGVIFAKKECYQTIGLYNENYLAGEDTEWFIRANESNLKYERVPFVMFKRRIHDSNLSVEHAKNAKQTMLKLFRESVNRKKAKDA